MPVERVVVALGSNLGDRRAHLAFGLARLGELLSDVRASSIRETSPQGVPGDGTSHPSYLNAAVVGECAATPRWLLDQLLGIERERGRERPFPLAPRTLDLDLILFGARVIDEPELRVPHPRFRERGFVLQPVAEIAGDLVDPETRMTVEELLRRWEEGGRH